VFPHRDGLTKKGEPAVLLGVFRENRPTVRIVDLQLRGEDVLERVSMVGAGVASCERGRFSGESRPVSGGGELPQKEVTVRDDLISIDPIEHHPDTRSLARLQHQPDEMLGAGDQPVAENVVNLLEVRERADRVAGGEVRLHTSSGQHRVDVRPFVARAHPIEHQRDRVQRILDLPRAGCPAPHTSHTRSPAHRSTRCRSDMRSAAGPHRLLEQLVKPLRVPLVRPVRPHVRRWLQLVVPAHPQPRSRPPPRGVPAASAGCRRRSSTPHPPASPPGNPPPAARSAAAAPQALPGSP
jgi:hypothetical protein